MREQPPCKHADFVPMFLSWLWVLTPAVGKDLLTSNVGHFLFQKCKNEKKKKKKCKNVKNLGFIIKEMYN